MNKFISGAIAALLVAGGVAIAAPAASATGNTETCVPSDAWTETITHPAVGEPTITIDNPDYVPATEDQTVDDGFVKWNWTGGPVEETPTAPPGEGWHEVGPTNDSKGNEPGVVHAGEGKASYFYYQPVTKVIPGTPAVGEPTVTIENPDYVPAYDEVIEHPAVTCEEPTTYTPSCTTVTGSATLVGDGVLTVEGDWDTASISVPFSGTLADIGTVLDIEADPIQYVGLHIDTAEGTIVFEEEPSYGGDLWSTSAWEGVEAGMGYAAFGSISEYIHLNGDVAVSGIRLLYTHPEASSTTVESFTIGCTVYDFREVPAQPADVVVTSDWSAVEVTCENEALDVIQQTRTITTTTFSWDAEAWAWVENEPTVVTEEQGYVVTSADIEALDCPVVTEPTPTTPAPAAVKPAALAATGAETNLAAPLIGGLAVLMGGLSLLAARVARARRATK